MVDIKNKNKTKLNRWVPIQMHGELDLSRQGGGHNPSRALELGVQVQVLHG
jgi:hypothetical protein